MIEDANHKGNVAEAKIAAAAIELGIPVLAPVTEHGRYDLAFDFGSRFLRVQCKWAPRRGDVVAISLTSFRYTSRGQMRSTYSADEIDAVAAYCADVERCYLIPADRIAGMHAFHLRLAAPKNGQIAALNWAAEFEFAGAVAQLGERRRGTAEATGSSPVSSTRSDSAVEVKVGAHEFREHFGWYMQRAAAGEKILVTRRGKPTVRLLGANEQTTLLDERGGGRIDAGRGSTSHEDEPSQ